MIPKIGCAYKICEKHSKLAPQKRAMSKPVDFLLREKIPLHVRFTVKCVSSVQKSPLRPYDNVAWANETTSDKENNRSVVRLNSLNASACSISTALQELGVHAKRNSPPERRRTDVNGSDVPESPRDDGTSR